MRVQGLSYLLMWVYRIDGVGVEATIIWNLEFMI